MDGDEALEADGDRHENGCHEGNLVEGVQEVREQDYVQPERVRGRAALKILSILGASIRRHVNSLGFRLKVKERLLFRWSTRYTLHSYSRHRNIF